MTHAAAQSASNPKHQDPLNLVAAKNFDIYNVYRDQIFNAHPPNIQYHKRIPVFIDPANKTRYILLTTVNVEKWAKALVNRLNFIGPFKSGITDLRFLAETQYYSFASLAATQTQI
jgi:hypothetical protein